MDRRLSRRAALLGFAGLATSLAGCGATDTGDEVPDRTSAGDGTGQSPGDGTGSDGNGGGGGDGDGDGDADTTTRVPLDERRLGAEVVAEGFPAPLGVEVRERDRYLVADQRGRVFLVEGGRSTVYLDVRDRLAGQLKSEMGLLGIAFHPSFDENGRLFVRYSADPREGTPTDYSHTFVLSEFRTDPGADSVDPSTERTILEIPEPQANHNSGAIVFGPDGYLYVGVGDGGWARDQGKGHVQDWYDRVGGGKGQDVTENLLGSVLRIDVDGEDGDRAYAVPDDNPLVGAEGLDEHYAWGLRNPWRMSFGPDGRLFVADVGQSGGEEVNVVEKGGNYGWNVSEGAHCFEVDECPTETPDGDPLRMPIVEYSQEGGELSGNAVIGGHLYDGDALPAFRGDYVFADYRAKGRVFVAREPEEGLWSAGAVPVDHDAFGPRVTAFGRDADGELLVCSVGDTGRILRLTPA
jgi:glucose/arabinose dehydrogenase